MKLAFYQGRSLVSKLIRWMTWGDYSHVAIILDDGRILEAWHKPNGVRWISHLGEGHQVGTRVDVYDLPELPFPNAAAFAAESMIGQRYDFWGVLGFVFRRRTHSRAAWFCSEAASFIARSGGVRLLDLPDHKISPSLLTYSPLLALYGRAITGKTRTVIRRYPDDHLYSPEAAKAATTETLRSDKTTAPDKGEFCHRDCANFVCADTGRCWKLDCCPDISKRETKRIEVADEKFDSWKADHDAKAEAYRLANPIPPAGETP